MRNLQHMASSTSRLVIPVITVTQQTNMICVLLKIDMRKTPLNFYKRERTRRLGLYCEYQT
jgi:hypothetical protein